MILSVIFSLTLFAGMVFGLGWPLATRLDLDSAEKLTAAAALSILAIFLFAWVVYITGLPVVWLRILPFIAALGLVTGWRSLIYILRDSDAAKLVGGQMIVALWSIGGLSLIVSYSGGSWVADWFGHWQRTSFFLEREPRDILFNGFDPLTSRPPLANIVNGAFLEITRRNFVHYQLFSTLFSSLVFLPAALLARRFGGSRTVPVLVLLFMVNPMYAQNVTYAWTKLPAAFFTLVSLYFFLRSRDSRHHRLHAILFAVSLAAGLLTHYSAGPYAVLMGILWFVLGWHQLTQLSWWRTTAIAILAGTLVLATWFGWTFAVYGVRGSLLTNTSVTDHASGTLGQLQIVLLNLRDTFVPHFLRAIDPGLLAQSSSLGWWRDWFFQLYQVNFFFAFGSVAWAAILTLLLRQWKTAPATQKMFWTVFIVGNAALGVAAHGGRDAWGLAHICLQPLILLGLAFLAAHWSRLSRPWRLILIACATADFVLGIFLQFGVQACALECWFTGNRTIPNLIAHYSIEARMNFAAKVQNQWVFAGDIFFKDRRLVIASLALLFLSALWLVARDSKALAPEGEHS